MFGKKEPPRPNYEIPDNSKFAVQEILFEEFWMSKYQNTGKFIEGELNRFYETNKSRADKWKMVYFIPGNTSAYVIWDLRPQD